MFRHQLRTVAVVALVAAVAFVAPAGAQFVSQYLARTFTSTAPAGAAAFAVRNAGAYVCLNAACSRAIRDNGGVLELAAGTVLASGAISAGGISTGTGGVSVNGTGPLYFGPQTLGTCNAGGEGYIRRMTGTGGTNTLTQTRFCACVSDGAASPTYSWRNVISGTAGTATTCNP